MSKKKKAGQVPKRGVASKSGPDKLVKTGKKGSVELTEAELDKVSGGALHKIKISL